jgi:hypothetical protein
MNQLSTDDLKSNYRKRRGDDSPFSVSEKENLLLHFGGFKRHGGATHFEAGEGQGEGEGNAWTRDTRVLTGLSLSPALSRWERENHPPIACNFKPPSTVAEYFSLHKSLLRNPKFP